GRPALARRLEGVVAVVELQLGPADGGGSDLQADLVAVLLPGPPLAAVGAEVGDRDAERAAGRTVLAGGMEQHPAKVSPAGLEADLVLRTRYRADVLILQAPELLRQIATGRGRGDVAEEGFHVGRLSFIVQPP